MAYFNPFQMAQPMMPQMPMPQMMPQQQVRSIDPQQFRQFAITLNDDALNNFAQMARQRGISEVDIQNGIRFIKSM
jgi:hypothetical protein